jgi:hypothetical protein
MILARFRKEGQETKCLNLNNRNSSCMEVYEFGGPRHQCSDLAPKASRGFNLNKFNELYSYLTAGVSENLSTQ